MEADRRNWAFSLAVSVLTFCLFCACAAGAATCHGHYLVYVGTYGHDAKGVYAYRFDDGTGKLSPIGLAAITPNPMSLVSSTNGRFLYATNISNGTITAFAIQPQIGKLTQIDQVPSRGAAPAYISLDKGGRFALIANYTGGSVAVLPIEGNGAVGDVTSFKQHTGSGSDPKRQSRPHPHSINVSPNNKYALAADLGLDKLFIYHFDSVTGALSASKPPYVMLAPGSGPRHFVFSPNRKFVYVISEMGSTVTVLSYASRGARLHILQVISSLPKGFRGKNTGAEIQVAPSGRFLYASNRGDDTIVVFAINARSGLITPVQYAPAQGKIPGMFAIDPTGCHLIVANAGSDNLAVFRIDQISGRLTPVGQPLQVPNPSAVSFVRDRAVHARKYRSLR